MPTPVRTDTADSAVVPPSSFGCAVVVGGVGLWPGLAQPLAERVRVGRPAMHVESLDLLDAAGRRADPLFADLIATLRDRVEALPGPVTLVAESLEAAVVLGVAIDPPPSLVAWGPTGVRPDATTIVTVGRASNAMHHRAARAISKDRGRHVVAGPGHLASLEAPAALADITLIATDAAHARYRAREAGHPSSRFVA